MVLRVVEDPNAIAEITNFADQQQANSVDVDQLGEERFGYGGSYEVDAPIVTGAGREEILKWQEDLEDESFGAAVQDTIVSAGHGLTFGFDDDLLELIGVEGYENIIEKARRRSPVLSITGEIAGSIVPIVASGGAALPGAAARSLNAAKTAVTATTRAGRLSQRARNLGLSTAASRPVLYGAEGAGYGAIYGAGEHETWEGVKQEALFGAAFGLGLGSLVSGSIQAGRSTLSVLEKFDAVGKARLREGVDDTLRNLESKNISTPTQSYIVNNIERAFHNQYKGAYDVLSRNIGDAWRTSRAPGVLAWDNTISAAKRAGVTADVGQILGQGVQNESLASAVATRNRISQISQDVADAMTNDIRKRVSLTTPEGSYFDIVFRDIDDAVGRAAKFSAGDFKLKSLTDTKQLDRLSKNVVRGQADAKYLDDLSDVLNDNVILDNITREESDKLWNKARYDIMSRVLGTSSPAQLGKILASGSESRKFIDRLFRGRNTFGRTEPTSGSKAVNSINDLVNLANKAKNLKNTFIYQIAEANAGLGFIGGVQAGLFGTIVGGPVGTIAASLGFFLAGTRATAKILQYLMEKPQFRKKLVKLYQMKEGSPEYNIYQAELRNIVQAHVNAPD